MSTLYNILAEHKALIDLIEQNDGEITPEIEVQANLTQEDFENKATSYAYVIKASEDEGEIIAKEIKRLQDLKKRADNRAEYLKNRLSEAMQQFGFDEIKRNNIRLYFRASKSVLITDENIIPDKYMVIVPETKKPDKAAIKAAIEKLEETVPGAEIEERKNLQIK
ncbi:MAG TPA: siphovirus Gp157 family protein [Chitinophagales bacterium]|nr:siphovirus Gp157 family protein [Chitinophagales bacterium]